MFKLTPTNSKEIDAQNQRLVDCMNQLYGEVQAGVTKVDILKVFDQLLSDSEIHFANEERGMARLGYHDINKHTIQHQRFITKIKEIRERVSYEPTLAVTETLIYLRKWLLAHIEKEDANYVQFMDKKIASSTAASATC